MRGDPLLQKKGAAPRRTAPNERIYLLSAVRVPLHCGPLLRAKNFKLATSCSSWIEKEVRLADTIRSRNAATNNYHKEVSSQLDDLVRRRLTARRSEP